MERKSVALEFDCKGIHYKGCATPSDRIHDDGLPASYTIVLNQVFFGDISRYKGKWVLDERRPHELIVTVGECIDQALQEQLEVINN